MVDEWTEPYTLSQRYQIQMSLLRYEITKRKESLARRVVNLLPKQVKLWVIVQAASGVCNDPNMLVQPDKITYPQMCDWLYPPKPEVFITTEEDHPMESMIP